MQPNVAVTLVPSGTPQNLTAQNWTSLYTLPVTWQPVAANHMNGKLTGYYLTYSAVKQGDKEVFDNNITGVSLPPHQTSYTITGLLPLSVYRISVSASTRKGAGPKATTFGGKMRYFCVYHHNFFKKYLSRDLPLRDMPLYKNTDNELE